MAYVSTLTLGLLSAASVNYIMFLTTRTLTGLALAGFTFFFAILLLPPTLIMRKLPPTGGYSFPSTQFA